MRLQQNNLDFLIGQSVLVLGLVVASVLVLFVGAMEFISRFIFLSVDFPAFAVIVIIAAGTSVLAAVNLPPGGQPRFLRSITVEPWHIAIAALAISAAAVDPIYQDYTFSMDEFMVRLQGRIFGSGTATGEIPEEWRSVGRALFPSFTSYDYQTGLLASTYRPGMALLYAGFELIGLGSYVSSVLTAGSIILIASVARQLWPNADEAPVVAAFLLASSQQVMITSLTAYAMPAHLFFNLLWLRLFLNNSLPSHVLAALVGVYTASLHQVHLHVFFAAPFFFMLLRPLRPWIITYYGVVYLVGHLAIIGWDHWAFGGMSVGTGDDFAGTVDSLARLPGLFELSTVTALIVRFFAWQNLALVPLIILAVRHRRWPLPLTLMVPSILLSLSPYPIFAPDQGHGWGYRYLHGLIGNFVLIGVAGWLAIDQLFDDDRRKLRRGVVAATALTVLIMLPLRAHQVRETLLPFARSTAYIESIPADVVIVDNRGIFYGTDLVRNDPYLANRPVVLSLSNLKENQIKQLCRDHSVTLVDIGDLEHLGMIRNRISAKEVTRRGSLLAAAHKCEQWR